MSASEVLIVIAGVAVFAGLITLLAFSKKFRFGKGKKKLGFTLRVLSALIVGLVFGILLQVLFGAGTPDGIGYHIRRWINLPGAAFTQALQFVVVPLVLVSIINAITKMGGGKGGLKKSGKIVGFLLVTTAISALLAISFVGLFRLSAGGLVNKGGTTGTPTDILTTILSLVPTNLFAALSANSILPILFIAVVVGAAYLALLKSKPSVATRFESFLETAYAFVMKIVSFVIRFTPYGVLSMVAARAATGTWDSIVELAMFIVACFAAMAAVFIMHLIIAWISGVSPVKYLKKSGAALLFAFSSRSSAATLPLTVSAQRNLGVGEANANLAGSLGTCIGQNGCAGVFPPMVAMLVGLVNGYDVWSFAFIVPLVLYTVIASIGTAGVGGGATNVSLVVLSMMGLPLDLVAFLTSVDFIIDMGRTAVNVSDSILAGVVVSRTEKDINKDILHNKITVEEYDQQQLQQKHAGEFI